MCLSLAVVRQAQQRKRREPSSVGKLRCARPYPGHFAAVVSVTEWPLFYR